MSNRRKLFLAAVVLIVIGAILLTMNHYGTKSIKTKISDLEIEICEGIYEEANRICDKAFNKYQAEGMTALAASSLAEEEKDKYLSEHPDKGIFSRYDRWLARPRSGALGLYWGDDICRLIGLLFIGMGIISVAGGILIRD